jgi:hypothetical protein
MNTLINPWSNLAQRRQKNLDRLPCLRNLTTNRKLVFTWFNNILQFWLVLINDYSSCYHTFIKVTILVSQASDNITRILITNCDAKQSTTELVHTSALKSPTKWLNCPGLHCSFDSTYRLNLKWLSVIHYYYCRYSGYTPHSFVSTVPSRLVDKCFPTPMRGYKYSRVTCQTPFNHCDDSRRCYSQPLDTW